MLSFSVFNLNIMHGRNSKSPIFPLYFNRSRIQNNLQKIADLIKKQDPDIITLQEVDHSSVLSGSFDQFEFLKNRLSYPYGYFASSCSVSLLGRAIFVSGNAILSKYPLQNCQSFKFSYSFPTDRMGFALADVILPSGTPITAMSVHLVWLDWIRFNSRMHELRLVEQIFKTRKNKTVVAGDFNCDFSGKEKSLRLFTKKCNLHAYNINNKNLHTSPSWNPSKRIDWILLPEGLNFISYKTLSDTVSDHVATFTEISI